MRVCYNVKLPSLCRVILNVVKNLTTSTIAFQILRDAQDDNMIGTNHYDTPPYVRKKRPGKRPDASSLYA